MTATKNTNATHKRTAESFLKLIEARRIREAYETYTSKEMKHHNIYVAGDASSLREAMEEAHRLFPDTTIDIKHSLEDGDFVAVHSLVRMQPNGKDVSVVHLFRFEGDLIAEMWDVGQEVPASSPNTNGAF